VEAGTEPEEQRASRAPGLETPARRRVSLPGLYQQVRAVLYPRRGALAAALLGLVVIGYVHGQALLTSLKYGHSAFRIADDARQQIFPFFRYIDQPPMAADYIADYYLACYPLGYFGLYAWTAKLGLDPALLSHYLPHVLLLITLLGLGAAGLKLGGKLGAFCTVMLALGCNTYIYRLTGGLPRSFGFPILAVALYALAFGRVWWCSACVVCGALFYPVTGVVTGLALAGLLLLPGGLGLPLGSWSWKRRLTVLVGTGALAVALLIPSTISCGRYGSPIRPDETAEFPEVGPGGRYGRESRAPFAGFFESFPRALAPALLGAQEPLSKQARAWLAPGDKPLESVRFRGLLDVLLLLCLLGGFGLLAYQPAARRVLLLGVSAGMGHTLARFVVPYAYLPERYVAYPIPLLGTLAIATCVSGMFPPSFQQGWQRWLKTGAIGAYVAALLWLLGGRVSPKTGLSVDLRPHQALYQRIAQLPPDALVAGWPKGIMNDVPYASRRRAFVTLETHQAFHKGYLEEMRRRMRALIEAYFASSPEALIRLRDEFGVTHLLVERAHFGRQAPTYFRPYRSWLDRQRKIAKKKGFEVPRQIPAASVYSFKGFELLDLTRIQAPH
jgi:hypothetical protein